MGMIAAVVGAGHLAAWLGGYLTQRGLSTITMKTNAALCLTLVGVALMLLVLAEAGPARRWTARVCAALALLAGLLTFMENLSSWDFGIDQLLAAETPGAMATTGPNRMGMPASLSFTLIGPALLILSRRDRRGARVAHALALAVCLIALLPTVGFLYGAREFYGIARYTGIAWPTAVALLLLGLGLLCARPAEGLMAQVTANDPGGVSIRRLLPAFVILPLLLGWLRLAGERAGVFDAATGTGMMMLLFIIIFSALTYHASRRASRSAEAVGKSQTMLSRAEKIANIGSWDWDIRSGELIGSEQTYRLFGVDSGRFFPTYDSFLSYVHPEDRQLVVQAIEDALTDRRPYDIEYRIVLPGSSTKWIYARGEVVFEDSGRPIHMIGTALDITERKRAEEALHEAHERAAWLARFPEENPNPVLRVSAEGTVLYRNPATGRLPEWRCEIGRLLEEPFLSLVQRAMAEGRQAKQDVELGGRFYAVWVAPVPSERYANIYGRDITERKRAEEALREANEQLQIQKEELQVQSEELQTQTEELRVQAKELTAINEKLRDNEQALRRSEERFRVAEELSLDAFTILDVVRDDSGVIVDFRWTYVNPEAGRILRHPPEELVGRRLLEVLPGNKTGSDLFERYVRVAETGKPHDYELSYESEGIRGWFRNMTVKLGDGIAIHFADITERKRAEEALREALLQVETEKRHLEAVLQSLPVGVIITDAHGSVLLTNGMDEQIWGPRPATRSVEDYVRYRAWWADSGKPVEPHEWASAQAVLKGESVFGQVLEIQRFDGTRGYVLNSAVPIRDGEGRVIGSAVAIQDITELRRAEQSLRELNATLESKVAERTAQLQRRARQLQKLALELSQAEERERRRVAVILHEDLQQQIAGARFHLNLVRSRAKDDPQRACVDKVDEMLKEVIEESRSLSHDLSPAMLHMNDLAEALRWLANRVREQHGLIAHVDASGEMTLQSEPLAMFLFRAAQEMLFNVVKHARVNEATIRARRLGRYVCLCVSDQGRGFDPRELKETSGFGLLSLRERTELLGGRLKIKSVEGQGSSVRIVVPDGPKAKGETMMVEDVSNLRVLSSAVSPPSSGGALRVLLVDDHEIVRQGLGALLQESPDIIVVGEAADGREAIDMTHELRPDVVVMDVAMPLMSGEEATRQIKTHLPKTRVIALSMYHEPDKMEMMYQAGAESYVLKTASAEELLAAIHAKKSDS